MYIVELHELPAFVESIKLGLQTFSGPESKQSPA